MSWCGDCGQGGNILWGIYSIGLLRLAVSAELFFFFFFFPSARCNYGAISSPLGRTFLKNKENGSTDSSDDT